MRDYGFVYVLCNPSFPNIYKVGCTERSPQRRADELSMGTGVPTEYAVVAYIECDRFQDVEREIHSQLASFRVNPGREFFKAPLELIARLMFFHPRTINWVDCMCRENISARVCSLDDPYKPARVPHLRRVA